MATNRARRSVLSFLCIGAILYNLRIWTSDQSFVEIASYKLSNVVEKKGLSPSSTLEPVHLMYASDDKSLPGVEASIRSVLAHASGPVHFHYVGDTPLKSHANVTFYNLTKVSKKYKLKEFTNPRERGANGYHGVNGNIANYARFAMDSLLPNQSRAMWIDVDTIVRCDVAEMVRNALSQDSTNVIAAVSGDRSPRGFAKWVKKEYNISRSFNAGVYVVDLDKWREQKITSKIREIAQQNQKTKMYNLGSQAPLALAIEDHFERLPWIWNVKVSHFDRDDRPATEKETCVMHWSGPEKPWEGNGLRKDLWLPYATDENK